MEVPELEGKRVLLKRLEPSHAEALFNCSRNEKIWEYLPVKINNLEDMHKFVDSAIENRVNGEEYPFVIDGTSGKIIGTTRYLRIFQIHKNLNIGWTWYAEEVWRTAVNTETKYLLLK